MSTAAVEVMSIANYFSRDILILFIVVECRAFRHCITRIDQLLTVSVGAFLPFFTKHSCTKNRIYDFNFSHRRNVLRGVTYVRRVPVPPTFWTGGTIPPTFQDTGEEFVVTRGDLWRSNYTITVFGRGSAPDPITRELMSCLGSQACEVCGRACRAKPRNADAPVFFSCQHVPQFVS